MEKLEWRVKVTQKTKGTLLFVKGNALLLRDKYLTCTTSQQEEHKIKIKEVNLKKVPPACVDGAWKEITFHNNVYQFKLECKDATDQERKNLVHFIQAVQGRRNSAGTGSSCSFRPMNTLHQTRNPRPSLDFSVKRSIMNRTRASPNLGVLGSPPPQQRREHSLGRQVDSLGSSLDVKVPSPGPRATDFFDDVQLGRESTSTPISSSRTQALSSQSTPSRSHTPPPTRSSASSTARPPVSPLCDRKVSSSFFGNRSTLSGPVKPSFSTPSIFDSEMRRPTSSQKEALSLLDSGSKTRPMGLFEGLANLGNTCYMNAVLQSLFAIPGFCDDLLSSTWCRQMLPDVRKLVEQGSPPVQSELKGKEGASADIDPLVFAALLRVVLLQRRKDHSVIDPSAVKKAMGFYFRPYVGRSQQDAHEFLGDLLNTLHEELCPYGRKIYSNLLRQKGSTALATVECKKNNSSSSGIMSFFQSPSGGSATQGQAAKDDVPAEMSEEETAFLGQILPVTRHFQAEVAVTLTCTRCSYSRSRVEVYHNFSIDLPEDKASGLKTPLKLEELVDQFFADQELELACEKCGHNEVKAVSRMRRLPAVLVVHIKRFKIDGTNNLKLTTKVRAPPQLDLTQVCDKYTRNAGHHINDLGPQVAADQTQFLVQDVQTKKTSATPREGAKTPTVPGGKGENALNEDSGPANKDDGAKPGLLRWRILAEEERRTSQGRDRWEDQEDERSQAMSKRRSPDPAEGDQSPSKKSKPAIIPDDEQLQEAIRRSLAEKEKMEAEAAMKEAEDIEQVLKMTTPVGLGKENMCPNQDRSSHLSRSPYDLQHFRFSKELRAREDKLKAKYDLKSVIRHIGKWAFSGHYIADIRTMTSEDGEEEAGGTSPTTANSAITWTRKDDSVVSKLATCDDILDEGVSLETGYLFFYTIHAASGPATSSRDAPSHRSQ